MALDEAMAVGQAQQRDRETGQGSLFDMLDTPDTVLERPLPTTTEAPSRERLRWEKELLGLYLSEHPLGELATEMAAYVNASTGEIGEGLDQQRIVVGGMVVGLRRVVTRNRETMAVATLEDLQGSVDVVVFPRVYAETGPTWAEEAVLLVSGRVDHKGDETVVLADTVWTWDQALGLGPDRFREAVEAGDRTRRGRRRGWDGDGAANGGGSGPGQRPTLVAVPMGVERSPAGPADGPAAPAETREIPVVSPLRGSQPTGTRTVTIGGPPAPRTNGAAALPLPPRPIVAPEPVSGASEPAGLASLAAASDDEPPLPDEARDRVVGAARDGTAPMEAGPGQVLHVRFASAPSDRLVAAFEGLRSVLKAHPGATPVVLHIPAGTSREQEMRLGPGVAYDAELLAEIERRLGGLLRLGLA